MLVKHVRVFAIELPFRRGTYTMSHGRSADSATTTIVELETDTGVRGYGESCPGGGTYLEGFPQGILAAIREIAPAILGLDPRETAVVNARMDSVLVGHLAAKSPIDIACLDIKGKLLGLPIGVLLGGVFQPKVPVFEAIPLGDVQTMQAQAQSMKMAGYRNFQVKVGAEVSEDLRRVDAVASCLGGWDFLTCDANGGWSLADAARAARGLASFDVFLEQPCRSINELSSLRARTALPFIACESLTSLESLLEIVSKRAADALNLKPTRLGGLTQAALVRDVARHLGMRILVDEPGGGDIAAAAMLHLAASTSPDQLIATSTNDTVVEIGGGSMPRMSGGWIQTIREPGLGIEVKREMLGHSVYSVSR